MRWWESPAHATLIGIRGNEEPANLTKTQIVKLCGNVI